jgi:hypothetical protein
LQLAADAKKEALINKPDSTQEELNKIDRIFASKMKEAL